jgi:hypothetical protein
MCRWSPGVVALCIGVRPWCDLALRRTPSTLGLLNVGGLPDQDAFGTHHGLASKDSSGERACLTLSPLHY